MPETVVGNKLTTYRHKKLIFLLLLKKTNFERFKNIIFFHNMHILDLENPVKNTVITVGTFDGVHLGHKKILSTLRHRAKQLHLNDVVVTFRVPPRLILNPNANIKVLTLIDEKIKLIEQQGISFLYILPFDRQMAQLPAEEFVRRYLVQGLGMKHLVVGFDHRFGKNREAGYEELVKTGEKYGFTVEKVDALLLNGEKVSSSRIRQAISEGKIEQANNLLGYNYFFSGTVTPGKKIGRLLKYPTANISINQLKLMPAYGVYLVKVLLDTFKGYGILNYGLRPTIEDQGKPRAEVHILDFSGDIYRKKIKIELITKLREEKKFQSLQALQKQISMDEQKARELIKR